MAVCASFEAYASLQDFFDRINRSARATIAGRDSDQPVKELILRRARFEPRRGPKVVPGWIDGLATCQRSQHLRRPMPEAKGRHVNQCAVVSLQRDSQIELENAVGAQEGPV